MKLGIIIFIFFNLLATCNSYSAQVYKWVDENGQTQFSQFPPAQSIERENLDINVPKSTSASKSSEKLKAMRQKLLENSVDRNTQNEEEKEEAKNAEIKAKNCQMAKQKLRDLKANGRVYKTLENGEREWYDEKGREGLINSAKDEVTRYCSK